MVLMILLVSTMIFFLFRVMPGDPTAFIVDPSIPPEARAQMLARYGLDKGLWDQYLIFMQDLLRLDFGSSYFYNRPVLEIIGEKLPATLILMLSAMTLAYLIGICMGALMAWKRGSKMETGGIVFVLFFRSAPTFWVGLMAIILFSANLGWFPAQGMRTVGTPSGNFAQMFLNMDFLHHLILPSIVAALYFMATPLLVMRNSMLEVLSEDYVEMAHAKGIKPRKVLFRHAARNALLPVVTSGALFIGSAIGGQVLIEVVFSWPGLGREIVTAVTRRDYPLAQACFIIISTTVMLMNLVADLLYAALDPRISYKALKGDENDDKKPGEKKQHPERAAPVSQEPPPGQTGYGGGDPAGVLYRGGHLCHQPGAPWRQDRHYNENRKIRRLEPPSLAHPFGTTDVGRTSFPRSSWAPERR